MKMFECRMPSRVRRAFAAASAVARHFYGDVDLERVTERGCRLSESETLIGATFITGVGRKVVTVHLREYLGCDRAGRMSTSWVVIGIWVGEQQYAWEELCSLHDRLPGGIPHFGLEYVTPREMAQLDLPGVEAQPAQATLPLGRQPELCYLFG